MTENESLKIMLAYKLGRGCKPHYSDEEIEKAFDTAISALQEIRRYREIGTVEECREAVEKQKAKELVYESDSVFSNGFSHYRMGKCPMCDRYYNSSDEVNYCSKCGQALMNENLEGRE